MPKKKTGASKPSKFDGISYSFKKKHKDPYKAIIKKQGHSVEFRMGDLYQTKVQLVNHEAQVKGKIAQVEYALKQFEQQYPELLPLRKKKNLKQIHEYTSLVLDRETLKEEHKNVKGGVKVYEEEIAHISNLLGIDE